MSRFFLPEFCQLAVKLHIILVNQIKGFMDGYNFQLYTERFKLPNHKIRELLHIVAKMYLMLNAAYGLKCFVFFLILDFSTTQWKMQTKVKKKTLRLM